MFQYLLNSIPKGGGYVEYSYVEFLDGGKVFISHLYNMC